MPRTIMGQPSVAAQKWSRVGSQHRRHFARSDRNTLIWPMVQASVISGICSQAIIRKLLVWYTFTAVTGNFEIANIFPALLKACLHGAGQRHSRVTHWHLPRP